jgi:hypothetical protein
MTLAAAADTHRSWAWLFAALAAYGLFLLFTPLFQRIGNKIRNPSPPPAIEGVRRTKVQATVGVTEDEPIEPAEEGWWGRIKEVGGIRFRQAKQIMATGGLEEGPEHGDDDVDVPLDDEPEDDEQNEKIEEYIARARGLRVPYNAIVKVVVDYYGVSESTAKRRIREVDESRRPPRAA